MGPPSSRDIASSKPPSKEVPELALEQKLFEVFEVINDTSKIAELAKKNPKLLQYMQDIKK